MFAVFVFLIFAILGISLWAGAFDKRCRTIPEPINGDWPPVLEDELLCGERACPTGTYCGSLPEAYDSGILITVENLHRDREIESLNWGITTFDSLFSAFLTIFQCITMEGWTGIMYSLDDAYIGVITNFYFVLCVVICSLFLLNLTIAVMLQKYDDLQRDSHDSSKDSELAAIGEEAQIPAKITQFIIENDSITMKKSTKKSSSRS